MTVQKAALGTPNIQSVAPVSNPCTRATSAWPSTLEFTLLRSDSPSSSIVLARKGR